MWTVLAQGRALTIRSVGPDSDTERETLFQQSIAYPERAGALSDLARSRLLFGEWLRRRKRRGKAREQLYKAWESFEEIGAAAFAERTSIADSTVDHHLRNIYRKFGNS